MATIVPPEDFRELSVIPTHEDIITNQEPFLRENKIEGHYDSEDHYLDVQFRLLREDFIRPLRDGIQQLMALGTRRSNRDDRLQDVRVYENVRILNPVCTSNGVAYKIRFDITSFRRVQWENSKRLIFGSLLCLSKDNFMSFAFATVANRELQGIRKGEIEVRFVTPVSETGLRTGDVCQMVESIAFFEAYRPVLEGLKMIPPGEFPFKRYIVECDRNIQPPAYLTKRDGRQVLFDFSAIISSEESCGNRSSSTNPAERNNNSGLRKSGSIGSKVSVLDPATWPSAKDLELDDSQFNALQLALTKEFAVIQGPPGTGKTYIGLKIAKVLLQNARVWRVDNCGPILVVCFTNHALDQFLEEIHDFHPQGIVRVGGRSQSEAMQKCSLTKRKREMIEKRLLPRKLGKAIGEIRREMDALSEKIMFYGELLEKFTSDVVHEGNLTCMSTKQYNSLRTGCGGVTGKDSVIPRWLGLPVPPADPYQDGFAKPLVVFPFNADCRGLEYFSQTELAFISQSVRFTPGADGIPGGSLELDGTFNTFIEIPNFDGGTADARPSITLLAFIYPTGSSGPIISYDRNGYGFQIWQEGVCGGIGTLSAWFVQRDLAFAIPLRKAVLNINAWNFVGASYDHVTGMARLWHNGNEVEAMYIGEGFALATQFSIRIGAWASPWQTCYFKGRISHLHIYAEALTDSNIQAVGCISQKGEYDNGEDTPTVEVVEKSNEPEEEKEGEEKKTPDVRFEAYIMEDQRILETDEDIDTFNKRLPKASTDSAYQTTQTPEAAKGGHQGGGWQFQNPSRVKKKIKQIIRRELGRQDAMSEEEAAKIENVWELSLEGRWRLYRRWVYNARETCFEKISIWQETFDQKASKLKEAKMREDYEILRKADVIGMTTTGAARYHSVLQDMQPVITIVEEAAEVLEAHIITSLTPGCQHVILIGDHQQLRPNPTVYDLEINYNLDVSLFERMVKNGIQFSRLCLQHRMRPEIAKMLDHIYVEPKLENHESVLHYENIKGVERNLFFVDHNEEEDFVAEGKSRSNVHEAKFLTALCRYFIQQGYEREQITILTAYSGQLLKLKREMSTYKGFFEGVRVTVVDNFQGEENDIILLSLVRSERIGFLKILNRVCVALSRARKGFYIIGNATLLAQESKLWRNIFADMRQQKTMGSYLKLTCQNHPQNEIDASCAEDFADAQEGGCTEACAMKLECGHVCDQVCHPTDLEHKEMFACQQPCTKTCDLGHKCARTCNEECGPCTVRVPKLVPGCNHIQQIPCSVDAAKFKCMELVPKKATPCGHDNQVQCFVDSSEIICKESCADLDCGHPCSGNCSRCEEGRLHLPCQSPCNRTLFCGHTCKDTCVRSCPPCSEPCRNYCDHQRCKRNCGHPCQLCANRCTWQCQHYQCMLSCGKICNRPRCDEPCPKQLRCGHPCVGVCGEVCPNLCRVCNEEFSESEPGALFVELFDCGHLFEVKMLDKYMDEADAGSDNGHDVEIKYKRCPACSTPVLYARRYGNIVKKILADFEAVKRRIVLMDVAGSDIIEKIHMEVDEIKTSFKVEAEEILLSITRGRVTSEEVNKRQNQVTFLKFLHKLIVKHKITSDSNKELYNKIHSLKARVMKKRDCFSEQEIKEVSEELSRTELLALTTALESSSSTCIGPEDIRNMKTIKSALESGKAIAQQQKEDFAAQIKKLYQTQGVSQADEVTNATESYDMTRTVKAKNLALGPWYKCSIGHVYSAVERTTEADGSTRCPDCTELNTENDGTGGLPQCLPQ